MVHSFVLCHNKSKLAFHLVSVSHFLTKLGLETQNEQFMEPLNEIYVEEIC